MSRAVGSRRWKWLRTIPIWASAAAVTGCPDPPAPPSTCWQRGTTTPKVSCSHADDEPNDDLPSAQVIPSPLCDDVPVSGSLSGGDVDWFHANGNRCDSGTPHLHLGTDNIRACLFVQCATGLTGVSSDSSGQFCSDGATAMRHPSGLLGCCLMKPNDVNINVACSTTKRTLNSFVVVDGAPEACTPYDVKFHL